MRQEKGHRLNPKGFSQIPSFKGFKTELVSYAHSGCSIDKELEGQAWKTVNRLLQEFGIEM